MRRLSRSILRLTFVALAALIPLSDAAGQTGLATVTGIVSDASGGAVPGLTVTATNQATNINYTGVTNEAGNYIITGVPIGLYLVAVDLQGFKGVQSKVSLSAAQTARVDFKMEVGSVEERVDVVATSAVLQTENAVVGVKVDRDQIEKLPAQGRNLSTATLYTAGVTSTNPNQFDSMRGGGRPAVNGQRIQGNNFTVDGVDSNEAINNGITYQPSPDAVEQVSVETNNYSAELGNVAGRGRQHGDQVGDEPAARERFLLLARQPAGRDALGDEPGRRRQVEVLARRVRRHARRAAAAEQAVLLRKLSRRPPGGTADELVRDGRAGRLASGRSEQPAVAEHRDSRSADASAVSEQPDSDQPVQPVRARAVRR